MMNIYLILILIRKRQRAEIQQLEEKIKSDEHELNLKKLQLERLRHELNKTEHDLDTKGVSDGP